MNVPHGMIDGHDGMEGGVVLLIAFAKRALQKGEKPKDLGLSEVVSNGFHACSSSSTAGNLRV